jgi:NADPH-dependent curcumin reductase CurA
MNWCTVKKIDHIYKSFSLQRRNGQSERFCICPSAFKGEVKLTDFKLIEEEIPALKDTEFMVEAMFISPDPYQRALIANFPLGSTMVGRQVAR